MRRLLFVVYRAKQDQILTKNLCAYEATGRRSLTPLTTTPSDVPTRAEGGNLAKKEACRYFRHRHGCADRVDWAH